MSGTTNEFNANVFILDARWNFSKKSQVYLTATVSQTDAAFSNLAMAWATNDSPPPVMFDPPYPNDELPNEGTVGTAPLPWTNIEGLNNSNSYSDLDCMEVRTSIGTLFQMTENIGFFGEASYWDVSDDQPYLQDASGSVGLLTAGFNWTF